MKLRLPGLVSFNFLIIGLVHFTSLMTNTSSVQFGVHPLSNASLLHLLILTLSPILNFGLYDDCFISPYRLK